MAVADLGVAMGPRNTRRLVSGAVVFGTAVAVIAGLQLVLSPRHSTQLPTRSTVPRVSAPTTHLIYGMTRAQVHRLTGDPTQTQGDCWLFHPTRTGMVGSISVVPSFSTTPFDRRTTGDLKLCFLGGIYSVSYLRILDQSANRWVWAAWPVYLSPSR
jgi:hypothetical protein